MVENTIVIFCLSYTLIFTIFMISLWISQQFNTPRLLYFIAMISSISMIYIPVSLKQPSSPLFLNTQWAFFAGGLSILFAFKFFELAFGYQWTYIRQIPLKLAAVYIISLPRMPNSEAKLSRQAVRQESIFSIMRGICQFIVIRVLLYLIPLEWLTVSSSLLPLTYRYARYGLFSILLYLSIDFITGIGFGLYSFIFNLHMKPVFPAFPFASTSLRDFWSYRWNKLIQSSLHLISFVAIPNLIDPIISINKAAKGLLAFTLSGLIHEYVVWFVCGVWSGKYMLFFFIHGLLVLLEITLEWPAKPYTLKEKMMGWLWTIGVMLMTLPLFFDPSTDTSIAVNAR